MDAGRWSHHRETWAGCSPQLWLLPGAEHATLSLWHSRVPLALHSFFLVAWATVTSLLPPKKTNYLQCHTNTMQDWRSSTNKPDQSPCKAQCQWDRMEDPLSWKMGWQHDQGLGGIPHAHGALWHLGYLG